MNPDEIAAAINSAKPRNRPKTLHHSDEVVGSEVIHESRKVVIMPESGAKVIVRETLVRETRRIIHVTKYED